MKLLIFIFVIIITISAVAVAVGVFQFHMLFSFNPSNVPPITANPVEADHVFSVSQFRSEDGHDFSSMAWDGESCRSMKHYFNWSQNVVNNMPVRSQPTPGHTNIKIFAPFDGTITGIEQEQTHMGRQVYIASSQNPSFYVRLFHLNLLPELGIGSKVSSGQQIATIGPMDGTDVSYEAHIFPVNIVYLSIFQYMTPQAFASYAKLGYKPSDFILTRPQADSLGYKCQGQEFVMGAQDPNHMPGVIYLGANPYQNLYGGQNQNMPQNQNYPDR